MSGEQSIGILGGAGKEGGGLALRWARAGRRVLIGSRSAERARQAADELNAVLGNSAIAGVSNTEAALADVVVLTVPYSAQREVALAVRDQLSGKILVDVTAPLKPPKVSVASLPEGGSACVALQKALGDVVRVVSAFQNISAHHLRDLEHLIDCDVLVTSDDDAAAEFVVGLCAEAGMRGWNAGLLANSAGAEAMTSLLIAINRRYKVLSSGLRITGVPAREMQHPCVRSQ